MRMFELIFGAVSLGFDDVDIYIDTDAFHCGVKGIV